MATFVVTVPDNEVAALADAFAINFNYPYSVQDGATPVPNPQTKVEFTQDCIVQHIYSVIRAAQTRVLEQQKIDAINQMTMPNVVITAQ